MPSGNDAGRAKKRRLDGDEMVQDPQCKVYVPLSRALERKVGGQTLYFCSEDCARKYVKEVK
jgi:YHS domain-containing protein